jgi:hypothetical protein
MSTDRGLLYGTTFQEKRSELPVKTTEDPGKK